MFTNLCPERPLAVGLGILPTSRDTLQQMALFMLRFPSCESNHWRSFFPQGLIHHLCSHTGQMSVPKINSMTTEQSKRRAFSSLWLVIAAVLTAWLALAVCVPNFVRSGTSKTNAIVNNLRQLDGAKEQWVLDHGRTAAVMVTMHDIAAYVSHLLAKDGSVRAIAGERYRLNALTESPEAQLTHEVDDQPKGTVIRLGTNNIEIISPTNRWTR
jgi:hypothetical protein